MNEKITAIVPAAGLGKRFDSSNRKTFISIKGLPLLIYTLKRLQNEDAITEIIPVICHEDMDNCSKMFKQHNLHKISRIAPGGNERQDSVYSALKIIESECIVLVHDGVRPFIPEGIITKLVGTLADADGAVPGMPAKDTIKEVSEQMTVVSTLRRDRIRAVQTPQAFSLNIIKKAYDKAYEDGIYATDDAALVERTGGTVKIIEGSSYNIKITTPEDLEMMKFILEKEKDIKVGCPAAGQC
jgi:2-C-methyl-D-erythritol 4-phosphate cytidylyltransferase